MQQIEGNNSVNHLLCFNCESTRNVDVLAHTLQGWRTLCLNCATEPEYKHWEWRCSNNNCVRPIAADNYFYCYYHHLMWLNFL